MSDTNTSDTNRAPRRCWCVVNHPQTPAERAEVVDAMRYARLIGDTQAIILFALMLGGPCPAWDVQDDHNDAQGDHIDGQDQDENHEGDA